MKSYTIRFSTFVYFFLITLSAIVLTSCREEGDEEPPRIFIESPFENQVFLSTDTVTVIASISDNEQLNFVEIELLSEEFVIIKKTRYSLSGSSVDFAQLFPIESPELVSGDYYIALRVSDGDNVRSGFVKIRINAIPKELEGILLVTREGNNTEIYYREVDASNFALQTDIFTDASGAGLNYFDNLFLITGGEVGNASFFEMEEYSEIASIPGFGSPGLPFFLGGGFLPDRKEFFVLQRDALIRIFNEFGAPENGFTVQTDNVPVELYSILDRYLVVERQLVSPIYTLNIYSYAGLLLDTYTLPGPALGLFERNDSEVFVWVQAPTGIQLKILNINSGLLSDPYQRENEELLGVDEISSGNFLLSTSEGLLRYNYSNGGTVVLNPSAPQGRVQYESLNGLVYILSGNNLHSLTPTGGSLGSVSFDSEILFLGFDYNR